MKILKSFMFMAIFTFLWWIDIDELIILNLMEYI